MSTGPLEGDPRRRLRAVLRTARRTLGMSQQQVAQEMDWSLSKMIRIENGAARVTVADLRALAGLYHIEGAALDELTELARRGRYDPYVGLSDLFSPAYIGLLRAESSATIIRQYHPSLIPGLLQTAEYAAEVFRVFGRSGDEIDRMVAHRMERRRLLDSHSGRSFEFVLDEAAIARCVAGFSASPGQLGELRNKASQLNVSIRVVPLSRGVHPGLRGPFVLLEFTDPNDSDVIFFENSNGDSVSRDDLETVAFYQEIFARLIEISVDVRELMGERECEEGSS